MNPIPFPFAGDESMGFFSLGKKENKIMIKTGGTEEVIDEGNGGAEDGIANPEDTQNNTDGLESEETANNDGEPKAGTDGETSADGDEGGSEDQIKDGEEVTPTLEERLARIEEENRTLKAQLQTKPVEQPQQRQKTEEEWQMEEQKWGVPRTAIQQFNGMMGGLYHHMTKQMKAITAKYEKESAINVLSQQDGFKDIQKYRQGIDEHLKKYPAEHHANPDLIEEGYFISKGKGLGKTVQRVMNNTEVNRKIISKNKIPSSKASPKSGGGSSGVSLKLTPSEESAWNVYKHKFASKEEYAKSLKRNRGK